MWVYILDTPRGYYTGYTVNIEKRLKEHRGGAAGAKFTRGLSKLELAGAWKITGNKSDAMKVEARIKALKRAQKRALISNPNAIKTILKQTEKQEGFLETLEICPEAFD